ncbi:class I SAM-dependent methyltransferase [Prolixibacteraceae bacterium JC049]|nr:class I SAM-dependent methyltransferase [Prolixibacteraceae bacterium JC049]
MTTKYTSADPFGKAIYDFYCGERKEQLIVQSDIAEDEELSPEYFFRSVSQMPKLEQIALSFCKGRILDVGAAAGAHTLELQQKKQDVTALEISPLACLTMEKRGVEKVIQSDIFDLKNEKFDTLLLLMNGSGIAGTLKGFSKFLNHLKALLNKGGSIIIDSSDLRYLYEDENGDVWIDVNSDKYYGQLRYEVSYKGKDQLAFDWLFVDEDHLKTIAQECGFKANKLADGLHYDYLYQLTLA